MKEFNAQTGEITGYTKMMHFSEAKVNDKVLWISASSVISGLFPNHLTGVVKQITDYGLDIEWDNHRGNKYFRKNVDSLYLKDKEEPIRESKLTVEATVDATFVVSPVITEVLMKLFPVLISSKHFKEAKELIDCLEALSEITKD